VLRLADRGAQVDDDDEERIRKAVLVLSSTLSACLAVVWVATYAALGRWVSAAIPAGYQLASATSIYIFARTGRYQFFRASQLAMSLVLPFALQWSLDGFENSSAVCLWAFMAPLGALLFVGPRQAMSWFLAFAGLVAVSGAVDTSLSRSADPLPTGAVVSFFVLNVAGVAAVAYVLLQYFVRAHDRERARSERLLLNVLPQPVAARLKREEGVIADACDGVTVLFADIVGFTQLSERLSAPELVTLLDRVFAGWDELAARYGVEKIKTIGDAYMVAGGVPLPRADHASAIADMALEMRAVIDQVAAETGTALEVRIGIDSGPVVAGVIGRAKFSYDMWGDTVNTASRMESHAQVGTIQVSERAFERLRGDYELSLRGTVDIKGKGPMPTHLLIRRNEGSAE
jgi:class 3 adenylate cyclase